MQCYEGHNKPDDRGVLPSSQRCGMLIKAAMDGAKDTPTCIRRSNMIMNLSPRNFIFTWIIINYIQYRDKILDHLLQYSVDFVIQA